MHMKKKMWTAIIAVLVVLCIATIIGFGAARRTVVENAVRAGLNTMLESGDISAEELYDLAANAIAEGDTQTSADTSSSTEGGKVTTDSSAVATSESLGSASAAISASDGQKKPVLTQDQAITALSDVITQKIPVDVQNEILNMVLSRLSLKEAVHIASLLLNDHSSQEERAEAKEMLYSKFSEDEIEKLKAYYKEYSGIIKND